MSNIGRIVLHIGKHKTGSTSIQATLHGVEADGFRYAKLRSSNHVKAFKIFSERLTAKQNEKKQQFSPELLAEAKAERLEMLSAALQEPCRTLLFSAEVLENLKRDEIEAMAAFLRKHTDRIEVVGFVRAPVSAQASTFQERVKHGWSKLNLPPISYRKSFEPYMQVLGPDAVKIVEFDPASFRNGSLVATLLHAVGEPDVPFEEKRSNEGMAGDATRLMFKLNRAEELPHAGKQNFRARQKLWRKLSEEITGPKLVLSAECHYMAGMEDEVEWLKAASGIDFTADLAKMSPDPAMVSPALAAAMEDIGQASVQRLEEMAAEESGRAISGAEEAVKSLYRAYGGSERVA